MRLRGPILGRRLRLELLVLAVAPPLLITALLGASMLQARLADARAALHERGRIIAVDLGMAAEFALLTRDWERLLATCNGTLRQPGVEGAAILDEGDEVLVRCGEGVGVSGRHAGNLYRAPIESDVVAVSDYQEEQPAADGNGGVPMGWAVVRMSLEAKLERERRIVMAALAITGGGLLVSVLAAVSMGNRFARPLTELSAAMARYRAGETGARVRVDAGGEIGQLQTGFNRMATSLEQSQSMLQSRVDAATEELRRNVQALSTKNTELRAAREEALAAAREKQEFLARMSHEMRTPLNAVIGFSRLLRDEGFDETTMEYIRTINGAANQLLNVIDDILSFIKIESGAIELERETFDPCACVEDVVVMLSRDAEEKGLELALVLHQDIPSALVGDPLRIRQVLANLLNNAIKFTATGHVLVEADFEVKREGAGTLRVVVSDTGTGLSPAEKERLFRPFWQAEETVTRRFGGTGLGLAICERLVALMGGEIGAEGERGQGSRFHFRIPCRIQGKVSPGEDRSLAGRKVLLYDAQPQQLRALRAALLARYMNIYNSGDSAQLAGMLETARIAGRPFEVVVLGLAAREREPGRLRALIEELRLSFAGPLLLLSAADGGNPCAGMAGLGRVEWMPKPARRAYLYQRLRGILGLGTGERESGARIGTGSLDGQRILVVEDNAFNRLLMHRILERQGAVVTEVADGAAAVSAASGGEFDAILMDIHMPGMDGVEATRRIRSMCGERAHVPVIAVSADVFARGQMPDADVLFEDFLVKPVTEETLAAAIRNSARRRTGHSEATPAVLPPAGAGDAQPGHAEEVAHALSNHLPADLRAAMVREIDRLLGRMEEAAREGERTDLADLGHQLRGVCGVLQAQRLAGPTRDLEQVADQAPKEELLARIAAIRELFSAGRAGDAG